MDVMILGQNSLRIKGKNASIVVNPDTKTDKTEAEGVVVLADYSDFSDAKIEGTRITIKGPGEYEVSGIKISALRVNGGMVAKLDVDNVKLLVGDGALLEKIQDKIEECQILVVNASQDFNNSALTTLEPNVLIVYGVNNESVVKSLGKEAVKTSKYSTTVEKLPQELEVVLLG